MLNIREELQSDLIDFFARINTDFYLEEYNDNNENMTYFIKDNCCNLYRPWSGDLWRDKNENAFASIVFDIFAKRFKGGYKLVFSKEKYKQFLSHEFVTDVFPVIACNDDITAPQVVSFYHDINDFAICWNGGKLQAYKIYATSKGRNYIKANNRRFYADEYIKL